MSFKISKPTTVPARGTQLLPSVEKLNMAMHMLGRVQGDVMQSAVRLGELIDTGILQFDQNGLLVPGRAVGGSTVTVGSFKNKLVNGHHRYWQRGTSLASAASASRFCADRWRVASNANAVSSSRQIFDLGQTAVPGAPVFYQRYSIDSVDPAAQAYAVYFQRIENLRQFAGKTITTSWYARGNVARFMSLEVLLEYGSGGSATENIIAPDRKSVGTGWQRFSQTMTVPSMAGKVHNLNNSAFTIHFWLAAGPDSDFQMRSAGMPNTAGYIDIACIQVEEGDQATPYEFRPDAIELMLCQRYFEKSYDWDTPPGTSTELGREAHYSNNAPGVAHIVPVRWKVPKRATPSLLAYGSTTGAIGVICQDDGSNLAASWGHVGENGAQISWANTAGRLGAFFHWIADAEW